MKTPNKSKSVARGSLRGRVSRQKKVLVTFYIHPDDGQNFVMPGRADAAGFDLAADHMGVAKTRIKAKAKYVTEDWLNNLPEYDG